jgi:sugar lactone lactonase YvrE
MAKPELREAHVLLTDLVIGESPRWHDGRLWFAHWGAEEIVAVDLDGRSEVVAKGPPGLGWSIDWLPDGRLLVTGAELNRRGRPHGHAADPSGQARVRSLGRR